MRTRGRERVAVDVSPDTVKVILGAFSALIAGGSEGAWVMGRESLSTVAKADSGDGVAVEEVNVCTAWSAGGEVTEGSGSAKPPNGRSRPRGSGGG
jgi:hypothetical protein